MPEDNSSIGLEIVKGLLQVQESAFRAMVEMMFNGLKEDIKEIRRDVADLRSSLEFSQANISTIESKLDAANDKLVFQGNAVEAHVGNVGGLQDKVEYLENQSRRNNVRIIGVEEGDDETWDKSEEVVKELVKKKLELSDDLQIERAHRVGRKRNHEETRPDGSTYGPRPIVAKFLSWKQREKVLSSARQKRPEGVSFFPDLSQRTLQRRADQIPALIQARKEGKEAYFILDKLIIKNRPIQRRRYGRPNASYTETEENEETEISFG